MEETKNQENNPEENIFLQKTKGTDDFAFLLKFLGGFIILGALIWACIVGDKEGDGLTLIIILPSSVLSSCFCFAFATLLENQGALRKNQEEIYKRLIEKENGKSAVEEAKKESDNAIKEE